MDRSADRRTSSSAHSTERTSPRGDADDPDPEPKVATVHSAEQREGLCLARAIERFADDLYGAHHPEKARAVRRAKASFTRAQLYSTDREYVLSTMVKLMRYTVQAVCWQGRLGVRQLGPLVRSLLRPGGDRDLVERYLQR